MNMNPRFESTEGDEHAPNDGVRIQCRQAAVRLLRELDERKSRFEAIAIGDPSWNMMLDLYIAACDGRRIAVSSLCIASRVPSTTALRWIAHLVEQGLVTKHADPQDGRRYFVTITSSAFDQMTDYLTAISNRR